MKIVCEKYVVLTNQRSSERFGILLMLEMGRCQMKKVLSQSISEVLWFLSKLFAISDW